MLPRLDLGEASTLRAALAIGARTLVLFIIYMPKGILGAAVGALEKRRMVQTAA